MPAGLTAWWIDIRLRICLETWFYLKNRFGERKHRRQMQFYWLPHCSVNKIEWCLKHCEKQHWNWKCKSILLSVEIHWTLRIASKSRQKKFEEILNHLKKKKTKNKCNSKAMKRHNLTITLKRYRSRKWTQKATRRKRRRVLLCRNLWQVIELSCCLHSFVPTTCGTATYVQQFIVCARTFVCVCVEHGSVVVLLA